jgi:hypothetical protein
MNSADQLQISDSNHAYPALSHNHQSQENDTALLRNNRKPASRQFAAASARRSAVNGADRYATIQT